MARKSLEFIHSSGFTYQIVIKDTGGGNYGTWEMGIVGLPAGAKNIKATLHFTASFHYNTPRSFYLVSPETDCGKEQDYSVDVTPYVKGNGRHTWQWYLQAGTANGTTRTNGFITSFRLVVEYDQPAALQRAENGQLVRYALYRAENGALVPYSLQKAEDGALAPY